MKKSYISYIYYTFSLTALLFSQTIISKLSFDNVYSKIFSKPLEEVIHKDIPLKKNGTLSIENISGNIHIKTEWKQNSIILKATKRISKKENPKNISIQVQKNIANNNVSIKTSYKDNKVKGSVDYELIIPNNIVINLKTNKGEIKVKKANGLITANTNKGDIKIVDTKGEIHANIKTQGNIIVNQSIGNITAITPYGNIEILNASKGITAQSNYGSIKVLCDKIPSTSTIKLKTNSGNISLSLPASTNAELEAWTARGKVTSTLAIELKPQTVFLNEATWKRFKREVKGFIGSGEATINLNTNYGNIKILKENSSRKPN